MRFANLVESRPEVLPLTMDQARLLTALGRRLASQRTWWGSNSPAESSVIRCEPAGAGTWRVAVLDAVGSISLDGLQLNVRPKIAPGHAIYLIEQSQMLPRLDGSTVRLADGNSIPELFSWWFVTSAEQLLRQGLARGYRTETSDLDAVIGRLDPVATFGLMSRGYPLARCEYQEFDEDTPQNRVIRAAALAVAREPSLPETLRARARRLMGELPALGPLEPGDIHVELDHSVLHYRDAIQFAFAVLQGSGIVIDHGAHLARSFLIRTPEMIEAGMRNVLSADLVADYAVEKRGRRSDDGFATFTPDLVFDDGAVADVKYRHLRADWSRADLNQALAFATAFEVRSSAVLGFTADSADRIPPAIRVSGHEVRAIAWQASPSQAPVQSRQAFSAAVRKWLQELSQTAVAAGQ